MIFWHESSATKPGGTTRDGRALNPALPISQQCRLLAVPRTSVYRKPAEVSAEHATILISEATNLPYKEDHFQHKFRRIADLAGLDFQFRDLCRGRLTETADAGATLVQLHATSGHRPMQSSEPYLVPTLDQADEAIRKREQMRARRKRNEN
jgi:hypothetical protein